MAWTCDPTVAPRVLTLWRGLYVLRSCGTGLNLDLCLFLPRPNQHLIVTLVRVPNAACSPLGRLQPFPQNYAFRFRSAVEIAIRIIWKTSDRASCCCCCCCLCCCCCCFYCYCYRRCCSWSSNRCLSCCCSLSSSCCFKSSHCCLCCYC